MQVLEKIFEEIDNHAIEFESFGMCDDYVSVGWVKEIIHSHMDEVKNNDWIPVEERLPEIRKDGHKDVIITDRNGNVYPDITYGYAEEKDKELSFFKWDDECWNCYKYDAIAWKSLPEPYKAE